jgi:predicted metal-dependent HD superfamily phosphohydrolase
MTPPDAKLAAAWRELAGAEHDRPDLRDHFEQLLSRLSEPHRRYHTATHVMWVLHHVDQMVASGEVLADPVAVQLAALYHDSVYDPRATDNEALSASLAGQVAAELGWPRHRRDHVVRLVLATATHLPRDSDEAVLIDADLAILGASQHDYAAYAAGVRAEYAHVPDAAWQAGRAAVLRRFLVLPHLYSTAFMCNAREAQARRNIAGELAGLSS